MPNAFGFSMYPQRPAVKPSDVGAALLRRAQPFSPVAIPSQTTDVGDPRFPVFQPSTTAPMPQSPFGVR